MISCPEYFCPSSEGVGWCQLGDNPCLLDSGDACDYYDDYVGDLTEGTGEMV